MIVQLWDQNENLLAFYRPTRPQRYNIGEVHGELHFVRNAGAGIVVRTHPPSVLPTVPPRNPVAIDGWLIAFARTDAPPAHGHRNGYSDVVPLRDNVGTRRSASMSRGPHVIAVYAARTTYVENRRTLASVPQPWAAIDPDVP
ncbi:hypothetical protein TRAPUB_10073 [Trametes pubescens]|uniref:Uncharacterized protein n=1 Tax=Trametes pubescens TaxID=154538 RepID=A0A1M2W0B6_TRAPU|nr:hypothetical protein TRAPUB_10073 [Trametes pubescens]